MATRASLTHEVGSRADGATWIPTNYMVSQGLRRYGDAEAARELAYGTFDLVLAESDTRESCDRETGARQGRDRFRSWSSLAYIMPLEYGSGYDLTTLEVCALRPLVCELLGVSFA